MISKSKAIVVFSFIVSISFLNRVSGQDLTVDYDQISTFATGANEAKFKLVHKGSTSLYYQIESNFAKNPESENEVIAAGTGKNFLLKKIDQKTITYNQPVINSPRIIRETIPLQKWTLVDEEKKLGEFACKKAKTFFRGREYEAWYTEDIAVVGGPWKFDGLPGLILEVYSLDDVFHITSTQLKMESEAKLPEFNYKEKDVITWDKFMSDYKKAIVRIKKSFKADSDPDVTYEFNIDLIEKIDD